MPNVHNMSLTAAIDVLFSVNFAVIFDFMYFCFRPSKAKCIGNVLPNRRNAAIRSMVFSLLCTAPCLLTHRVRLRSQATRGIKKKKKHRSYGSVSPIRQAIAYSFCFTGAETEIHKIKDDSKINREKNIDRRGQRHIVNVWHLSEPPSFSLPTTFKGHKF